MRFSAQAEVRALDERSRRLAERVAGAATTDAGTVLVIDTSTPGGGWTETVEEPSRALLQALAAPATGPLSVVVGSSGPGTGSSPNQAAALAAVHGTLGVAALERAAGGHRVNTVVVSDDTSTADLAAVLEYLNDEEAAGFTTGATIHLTRTRSEHGHAELPVLVTGAAGGLGGAVAEAFVAAGRPVIISDLAGDALDRQAERLGVPAIELDVTSTDVHTTLTEHPLLRSGLSSLQILHGVGGSGALDDLPEGVRERSLRINGTGVSNLVEALLPAVTRGGGSIVVLASQAGLIAEPGNGAYCAAKFAVVGYVEALARSVPSNVRVHTLCPGPIDTPLMRVSFEGMAKAAGVSYDEYHQQRMSVIPLRRFGRPDHVGAGALLLDRLDATGVILAPTGGFLLT